MRGLIVWDLRRIATQKRLLAIIVILCAMYIWMDMASFAVVFFPLFMALVQCNSVNVDLSDRVRRFFFSLPFSRKQYVAEKYLLSLGLGYVSMLVVSAVFWLAGKVDLSLVPYIACLDVLVISIFVSVSLPVEMLFTNRAPLVMMAVSFGVLLAFSTVIDGPVEEISLLFENPVLLAGLCAGVSVLCVAVSVCICLKITAKMKI